MWEMTQGQVGRILPGEMYANEVVTVFGRGSAFRFAVSLTDPDNYWHMLEKNDIRVLLFPEGTKIELEF
jgi:hypothetical protein